MSELLKINVNEHTDKRNETEALRSLCDSIDALQVREMKHADVWESRSHEADKWSGLMPCYPDDRHKPPLVGMLPAYPQEAEPDGRLWIGSGDSQ